MRQKYTYTLFIIWFYLLMLSEPLSAVSSIFKYVDELTAIIALPIYFIVSSRKKQLKFNLPFFFFILIGFIGTFYYHYQPFVRAALPDFFICIKFWLTIYAASFLFKHFDLDKNAPKIYFHVKLFTIIFIICSILVLIFPKLPFIHEMRYGLPSFRLFYPHSTYYAAACGALLVFLAMVFGRVKNASLWMVLICILMASTLRSKAIASAAIFIILYYYIFIKNQQFKIRHLIFAIPFVLYLGWSQISFYYFGSAGNIDEFARFALTVKSVAVANDHFPVGAGYGTYGSFYSATYYSPLYYEYGLANISGLEEGNADFVADTFWPVIIAQFGWFGLVLFIIMLIKLYLQISKISKIDKNIYLGGLFGFFYLCISSAAETAFMNSVANVYALIIGIGITKMKSHMQEHRETLSPPKEQHSP